MAKDNFGQLEQTKQVLDNSDFYYIITTGNAGNYSYINKHYANVLGRTSQ